MKLAGLAFALAAGSSLLVAQAAPRVTTTLAANELTALETVRTAVWVDWFSGDTAALSRVLGPELVAISAGAPHWLSRPQTIAASADFKAKGGKFVSVAFDSAMTHRFGETVVMFSHYTVVTENADKRSTQKGRATEVFVRANGKWVHTSWHLDRFP
jgi:SnoaL-like domain